MDKHAVVDGRGTLTVFEIYIKTTPERLWEAITDPEMRAKYSFGVQTNSDWKPGSSYESSVPGVVDIAAGATWRSIRRMARAELQRALER